MSAAPTPPDQSVSADAVIAELEVQLGRVVGQNTRLLVQNRELQKQVAFLAEQITIRDAAAAGKSAEKPAAEHATVDQ